MPRAKPTSTFGPQAYHIYTFSVTITPMKQRGALHPSLATPKPLPPSLLTLHASVLAAGVPFEDPERMNMCAIVQDNLYVEMGIRCQDKELTAFSFSRERGLKDNEPHLNGHYDMTTTETDVPRIVKEEHAWLTAILDRVTPIPSRLLIKMIPASNRTYGYGYDFKDMERTPTPGPPNPLKQGAGDRSAAHMPRHVAALQGKPHFRNIKMGISEEEAQQALDHYRAKAAQNSFSGCALHRTPHRWTPRGRARASPLLALVTRLASLHTGAPR